MTAATRMLPKRPRREWGEPESIRKQLWDLGSAPQPPLTSSLGAAGWAPAEQRTGDGGSVRGEKPDDRVEDV